MDCGGGHLVLMLVLLLVTANVHSTNSIIAGSREPCSNEGEPVAVAIKDVGKCFSCMCKNGFVECQKTSCPPIDGCHMLVDKTQDGCCQKCKGCWYRGKEHPSHSEWSESDEPCKVMRCEAGVVTESTLECYTPCANPTPAGPGKCCATCEDCLINGQTVTEDVDWDVTMSDDPCLKCRCSRGKMICSKKACPVLQCHTNRQHIPQGECCPKCTGTRSRYTYPGTCLIGSNLAREGEVLDIDRCTHCTCNNETSICQRDACPVLDCFPKFQKKSPGSCCPKCTTPIEEVKTQCTVGGKTYEDGESWSLDVCSSCRCHQGMPSCARTKCKSIPCSPGSRVVHTTGECCPKCEESEGVCMVFGDPHYKTFDGKIYSFQGIGKYQLTADCVGRSFSIRVANDKSSRASSLTKRVAIKSGDTRINLGQKYRTKVNGRKVNFPFDVENRVTIVKDNDNVVVTLSSGVKVYWNGKSFLEVSVPASFKSKLCGLCGNFNSNGQDDLRLRKGEIVNDTALARFGSSWCVGGRVACERQSRQLAKMRPCRPHAKTDKKHCRYLLHSELFNECDSKLNPSKYYKACIMDMCECPSGRCYCESLMAYAHECERLGVVQPQWRWNRSCLWFPADVSRTPDRSPLSLQESELHRKKVNRTRLQVDRNRPPLPIH